MTNPHAHVRILPGNCGLSRLTPSLGAKKRKPRIVNLMATLGNPPKPGCRGTITLNSQDDLADVGGIHAGVRRRRLAQGERGIDDDLHALRGEGPDGRRLAAAMPAQSRGGWTGSGGAWWPEGLGHPAASGSQNESRYAFFPEARRLAVETGGRVTLHDTGDHRIGGVSQQQGSSYSLSFTSQHGPVRLEEMPVVGAPVRDARPVPQAAPAPQTVVPTPAADSAPAPAGDVFGMIERLSELHRKGVLTEAEFAAKKTELLGRL